MSIGICFRKGAGVRNKIANACFIHTNSRGDTPYVTDL